MKKIFFVFILYLLLPLAVQAEYVLPYPSYMPGNTLYKVSTFLDKLKGYWYFGNIAQLKYRMGMADKKLIESKTLFEYKQYAFAMNAMHESTAQIASIPRLLESAKEQGIDMKKFNAMLCEQMNVHQEVLQKLQTSLPTVFAWQEEKKDAVNLQIGEAFDTAMKTRVEVQTQEQCL